MSLEQFLQSLENQFHDLTHGIWGDDPLPALQAKADRLDREVKRRYGRLVRQRAVVEGLRHRLGENERRAARLAEQVEVYLHVADRDNSWKHALELDQTRRLIELDKLQLQQQEQTYQDQLADVERLKRRLAGMREKIYLEQQWHARRA
jgi:hypothetical protein